MCLKEEIKWVVFTVLEHTEADIVSSLKQRDCNCPHDLKLPSANPALRAYLIKKLFFFFLKI